ncbi:MAG: radical SAM family heme chaperone HemW [Defluviitaleaceae bacterium]|nr:radical SAM family heme chaperone HemW [Defluviitaleaceae bacterium]
MSYGLYIHIPFCVSKCSYCDFLSFESTDYEPYVQALLTELKSAHITNKVDTVYIGGGTPTALPSPFLYEILQEVHNFNLTPDAEITVETNPNSQLPDLKSYGVNRLSIGLQAWQDDLLGRIKRTHTAHDFTKTIQTAKAAGIHNINVDLMFGLPGQTMAHWKESITQVLALNPTHISTYSLTPAENTPMWDEQDNLPDESTDRAMYHKAINLLTSAGYQHYELSNFAKPGYRSRHNVNCWRRKPYIGFGLGAHSFDGTTRWNNSTNITQYLSGSKKENIQILTSQDAAAEIMFLGLRMTEGISPPPQFKPSIDKLIDKGLLTYNDEKIALTPQGLDLANQVFTEFI